MAEVVPPEWLDVPVSVEQLDGDYGVQTSGVHKDWERLKSEMRPGDQLMRFVSSYQSWEKHAGRMGIALVRDGKVIDAFVTMVN